MILADEAGQYSVEMPTVSSMHNTPSGTVTLNSSSATNSGRSALPRLTRPKTRRMTFFIDIQPLDLDRQVLGLLIRWKLRDSRGVGC